MPRALLITNPVAARAEARAVRAVLDTLRSGGWTVDVLATVRPGDARRFAEGACAQGCDVVVCYGGDGTAMQIAAGLIGSGIALGLVPAGTGNLLAGNLRLPRSPVAAARTMLRGRPLALDLGMVARGDEVHYFAVACGAGFDAELMARTAAGAKHRWKMGAYVARAVEMLPRVASVGHRITVDGRPSDVEAAMVLVANCGEIIPPVLRLGPHIVPDDGWLDVVAIRAEGVISSAAAFWDLLRGATNGASRVWAARGRTVRVEVPGHPPRPVQLDGEPAGETPFEARLVAGALTVLADPAAVPHLTRQTA